MLSLYRRSRFTTPRRKIVRSIRRCAPRCCNVTKTTYVRWKSSLAANSKWSGRKSAYREALFKECICERMKFQVQRIPGANGVDGFAVERCGGWTVPGHILSLIVDVFPAELTSQQTECFVESFRDAND